MSLYGLVQSVFQAVMFFTLILHNILCKICESVGLPFTCILTASKQYPPGTNSVSILFRNMSVVNARECDYKNHICLFAVANKLETELREVVEPDYGLPEKLCEMQIITKEQLEEILDEKSVESRSTCLLQLVRKNLDKLKHDSFVKALTDTDQRHVASFINANGRNTGEFGDVWPLSKEQRSLLSRYILFKEMNSDLSRLQDCLNKNVLSTEQMKHVECQRNQRDRIKHLLRILQRRSVADLKNFIVCLELTDDIAKQLMDVSVTDVNNQQSAYWRTETV